MKVFVQTAKEEEFDDRHRAFATQGSIGPKLQQQVAFMGAEIFAQDDEEYNYTLDRPIQGIRLRPPSIVKPLFYHASPNSRISYNHVPRLPLRRSDRTSHRHYRYAQRERPYLLHSRRITFDKSTSTFKEEPASGDNVAC